MTSLQHWHKNIDDDQICWLYFDKANSDVNTIDKEVMTEFSGLLDELAENGSIKGIVIASHKKSGFIAGADIAQFTQFKDIPEAYQTLLLGDQILEKIEKTPIPIVAMIEGFCLGGGLELALACHYRVVEESAKTRLGLPEVKLGIHPGWGGTVRLPRLIGGKEAMNLILNGHTVSGKTAAKLGIADVAVPKRQLVHAAKYYVLNKPKRHQPSRFQALTNNNIVRPILAHFIRKQLRQKIKAVHYPAPYQVVDNWEMEGVASNHAFEREAKSCSRLFFSDTSQNLVRIFFLQEKLKRLAKNTNFKAQKVHVIGAGIMGGDIAAWCALRGMTVTLQDLKPAYIAPAIKRAHKLFKEKLKEPYLVQQAMDRLIPGDGIKDADVIIEAVIENLEVKKETFAQIEREARPDAILATNTSSIPLDEINVVLKRPERLVGIHFFNPVAKMQLVEVVMSNQSDADVITRAMSFVRSLDKLPLPVKSSPGFLVNRILMPYLLEAVKLLHEGYSKQTIDHAMTNFGMPMGPITLADTVGLDVCLSVAKYLGAYYDVDIPSQLTELVEAKKLGKKTGGGFYQYDKKGKQIKGEDTAEPKVLNAISDRLVLTILNESFACLREHVVDNGDLLDAGMVYGTGFAPFRGGPIHYAKSQGIDDLYQQFIKQQQTRGVTATVPNWENVES